MDRLKILTIVLWVWVAWHLVFGLLAAFAPEIGASTVGWSPADGWSPELLTMSNQYGMTMVMLALMYLIMALNPLRYLGLIWVAVAEQALGIVYAGYIYVNFGQLTMSQMLIQACINSAAIAVFILLWLGLRDSYHQQKA